jgi:hypothetical protein
MIPLSRTSALLALTLLFTTTGVTAEKKCAVKYNRNPDSFIKAPAAPEGAAPAPAPATPPSPDEYKLSVPDAGGSATPPNPDVINPPAPDAGPPPSNDYPNTTVPDVGGSTSLKFMIIADWGESTKEQKIIADQMKAFHKQTPTQFIIAGGDNFYDYGITEGKDDWQWDEYWSAPFGELTDIPWYIVLGNHDCKIQSFQNNQ